MCKMLVEIIIKQSKLINYLKDLTNQKVQNVNFKVGASYF